MRHGGDLSELLDSIDMEEWLDQEGIEYKKTRGSHGPQANLKECPFCGNAKWKTYIGLETGFGNCFVCNEKMNKWKFIKASLRLDKTSDVIAKIEKAARERGWRPNRKQELAVNMKTKLSLPSSVALPVNGRNLSYLENRNITGELAERFHLRFSLNGKFTYKDDRGYTKTQDYSKRIIIPIFDLLGDLASFQGRDITEASDKKYLFPPGYASTGSILYGGHQAHKAKSVAIGEGVFDVIAMRAAFDGDRNMRDIATIGTFGKHLSQGDDNSQLAKLLTLKGEGLKQVTIMWDGERAALEEAIKTALTLRGHGLTTRVALLPKGRDPNEVTPDVVRLAYWQAQTIDPLVATRLLLANIYA